MPRHGQGPIVWQDVEGWNVAQQESIKVVFEDGLFAVATSAGPDPSKCS